MKRYLKPAMMLVLGADAACTITAVHAQDEGSSGKLEEVVVTAERREADVQSTAASVSVQTGEQLAKQGRYSLNDILENVVGVSGLTVNGPSGTGTDAPEVGIAIRGIKSNSDGAAAANSLSVASTTAVYVDGIYSGIGGSYDIDRVEILRGPQGTLYGRSATGGVIATYTVAPDLNDVSGHVAAELGDYSLQHYSAAANVPVVEDKLAVRLSGNYYSRDGYEHPEGGAVENKDARLKFLYQPTENLSLLFGAALQDNVTHTGGLTYRLTGERRPGAFYADRATPVAEGNTKFRQYWADVRWDLGFATLSYLPALRTWEQDSQVYAIGPGGPLLNQFVRTPDDDYITHELHLTSNLDAPFPWQVGTVYYRNKIDGFSNEIRWLSSNALLTRREQSRDVESTGVFAEGTYPFTDTTRLTAGVRYDTSDIDVDMDYVSNFNRLTNVGTPNAGLPEDNRFYTVSGDAGSAHYSNTTYKIRLEHDLAQVNLLYAMVSSGFIPGDIQIASSIPPVAYKYDATELTSYEIGTKNRFLDQTLQLNGAIYFYDYKGYQTTVTPNPADPSNTIFVVTPAEMKGAELELLYQMTSLDRIGFGVSYIDAYWVDTPPGFTNAIVQETITNIPPITTNLAYDRNFDLSGGSRMNLHADVRLTKSYDTRALSAGFYALGAQEYVRVGDQTIGNLSAGWTSSGGRYSLTGYVRNVADKRYRIVNTLQTISPTLNGTVELSAPRTWGVILRVDF